MSLQSKLDEIAQASAAKMPADISAIMSSNTQALIDSGQAERAIGVGANAPAFTLEGPDGEVTLASLLESGPLVLTWFRGTW